MTWSDMFDSLKSKLRREPPEQQVVTSQDPSQLEDLRERPPITPAIDIFEGSRDLLIRADMPGAAPGKVYAYADGTGHLIVSATPAGDGAAWYRRIHLPESADPDKAEARYERGVLSVTLPKRAGFQPRAIPVRGA